MQEDDSETMNNATRSSSRLRNRSAKDNKDPNFIYEDPLTSSKSLSAFAKIKQRSASCSRVEEVKDKKDTRSNVCQEEDLALRKCGTPLIKDKQLKLSQQS